MGYPYINIGFSVNKRVKSLFCLTFVRLISLLWPCFKYKKTYRRFPGSFINQVNGK